MASFKKTIFPTAFFIFVVFLVYVWTTQPQWAIDFVDSCREIGINVPIIPGLKPIKNLNHITFLPKFFKIDFPNELSKELLKCKDNKAVEQVGIEWGINQSRELKANKVPCIHYYTMSNSSSVKAIAKEVF